MAKTTKKPAAKPATAPTTSNSQPTTEITELANPMQIDGVQWNLNGAYGKAKAESKKLALQEHFEAEIFPYKDQFAVYFKNKEGK